VNRTFCTSTLPPHQLIVDVYTKETFEVFHDTLEDMLPEADEDAWLSVTSTTVDNAANTLYLSLRQLLLTGKSEPPSSGITSIQNLNIKAMDGMKMFANMWVARYLLHLKLLTFLNDTVEKALVMDQLVQHGQRLSQEL